MEAEEEVKAAVEASRRRFRRVLQSQEAYPVSVVRQQLRESLVAVLQACTMVPTPEEEDTCQPVAAVGTAAAAASAGHRKSATAVTRYHPHRLYHCLLLRRNNDDDDDDVMDSWKDLCQHHDDQVVVETERNRLRDGDGDDDDDDYDNKSNSTAAATTATPTPLATETPLQLVLECFLDPTVVPTACWAVVTAVLWHVLIANSTTTTTRTSSSSSFLRRSSGVCGSTFRTLRRDGGTPSQALLWQCWTERRRHVVGRTAALGGSYDCLLHHPMRVVQTPHHARTALAMGSHWFRAPSNPPCPPRAVAVVAAMWNHFWHLIARVDQLEARSLRQNNNGTRLSQRQPPPPQSQQRVTERKESGSNAKPQNYVGIPWRSSTTTLGLHSIDFMHGDMSIEEGEILAARFRPKQRQPPPRVCRKNVMRYQSTTSTTSRFDGGGMDDDEILVGTQLLQWWKVKARCIRIFLKTLPTAVRSVSQPPPPPPLQRASAFSSQCNRGPHESLVVSLFLDSVGLRNESVTVRLCGILLAESADSSFSSGNSWWRRNHTTSSPKEQDDVACGRENHENNNKNNNSSGCYQTLLQLTWMKAQRASQIDELCLYLRLYSEWIVLCSYFDDPCRLYSAIASLVQYIQQSLTKRTSVLEIDDGTMDRVWIVASRPYLQCFAFILSRRGRMLLAAATRQPELHEAFTSLIAQLSLTLDRPSDWLDPETPSDEYERQTQALQTAGILGMMCDYSTVDCSEEFDPSTVDNAEVITGSKQWADASRRRLWSFPFPLLDGTDGRTNIETVAVRLCPWLPFPFEESSISRLFSRYGPINGMPPQVETAVRIGTDPANADDAASIMEYLNDDLLLNVFSFLNYKRLVRMRSICRGWKDRADCDRLWRSLYDARFGHSYSSSCNRPDQSNWKELFVDRWRAERAIRFRVCSQDPSWRVRLCRYVGCLTVLTTPTAMKRHYDRHRRSSQKTAAKQCLPKERKRKGRRGCLPKERRRKSVKEI